MVNPSIPSNPTNSTNMRGVGVRDGYSVKFDEFDGFEGGWG